MSFRRAATTERGPRRPSWFIFNEPGGAPRRSPTAARSSPTASTRSSSSCFPSQADQQREQLVRRLGAKDDVDRPASASTSSGPASSPTPAGSSPCRRARRRSSATRSSSVLQTARFENRLYAVPIWSNTQLLWYRKDRVPTPPKTWDEMIDEAEQIGRAKGRIQVQANRYEGLVVLVNQLIESAGTSVLAGPKAGQARQGADRDARSGSSAACRSSPRRAAEPDDLHRGLRAAGLRGGQLAPS